MSLSFQKISEKNSMECCEKSFETIINHGLLTKSFFIAENAEYTEKTLK